MTSNTTCINCGHTLTGTFCSQCGEKAFSEHDKQLSHFFHETFHFLTHLDGKFLTSLKSVFFKPGLLAFEYCQGIRRKYFKPVSLFLVGVIIYLFFPLIQGLNLSHAQAVSTFNAIGIHAPEALTLKKAIQKNLPVDQVAEKYNTKSPKFAKILLLILLPLTACLLWLLFFRKRAYLYDHLILSTEMNTFLLYTMFLIIPLLLSLTGFLLHFFGGYEFDYDDSLLIPIQVTVLSVAWGSALRRFYTIGIWETIWKTVAFFVLHSILLYVVYRLILFHLVMAFV